MKGTPLRRFSSMDHVTTEHIGRIQHVDCALRLECLDHAAKHNWDSFDCRFCVAYEKGDDDYEIAELGAAMFSAIALCEDEI